jgi:ketosteroid isomerase-like protein
MSTQKETQAVAAMINAYAETLNSRNARAIGGYYTSNGAILPNGHKTIQKQKLDLATGEFLRNTSFKIEYNIEDVTISGEYAFVESLATTSNSSSGNQVVNKTSRDLFILRKDQGGWKIYRYIFNDIK